MESDLLHTEKILADRKVFFLDLKQNARGMVVKITEDVSGNRDTIMVPAEILGGFHRRPHRHQGHRRRTGVSFSRSADDA